MCRGGTSKYTYKGRHMTIEEFKNHFLGLGYDICDMGRGRRVSQRCTTSPTPEMCGVCSAVPYEQRSDMAPSFVE